MTMLPKLTVRDAVTRLEGPLLFMRRTLDVGLNEAVLVSGHDSAPRLGRIAALDDDLVTIQRYAGRTNEAFTHLLVNLALSAGGGTMARRAPGSPCLPRRSAR